MSHQHTATRSFGDVSVGLFVGRITNRANGRRVMYLGLKTHDGPQIDQPLVPGYACPIETETAEFWQWAEQNLPIYDES